MEEVGRGDENIPGYRAEKLGRFGGNTLLTELMPIPKPKVRRWDYEELIPQYPSREDYYQIVKPRRIKYLTGLIEDHQPKVVVCYRKAFWKECRELFGQSAFEQEGQFQNAACGDSRVFLKPRFTSRSINGRFDDIAKIIR